MNAPIAPVSLNQLRDYTYCSLLYYWKHVLDVREQRQVHATLELPGVCLRQALRVFLQRDDMSLEQAVMGVWRTWLARKGLDQDDVLKALLGYAQALDQLLQGFESGKVRKRDGRRYTQPRMSPKFKNMARSSGLPALADSLDQKLIPALGVVLGQQPLVGSFSVADAFAESLRMARRLTGPGALPPRAAILGVQVPVLVRVGGWNLPAVADQLVLEDVGQDPPSVQVEVHDYDPFRKPHLAWVNQDLRLIAALHIRPRPDTHVPFGDVAGVTFRHMPSGWTHQRKAVALGRLTHTLEAALRGIMEGIYVPMFLHDLHRCESCVMRERCLNAGGLNALEALAPGMINRVETVARGVQAVMPRLSPVQRQLLASALRDVSGALVQAQGSAFDLPAALSVLGNTLDPVGVVESVRGGAL